MIIWHVTAVAIFQPMGCTVKQMVKLLHVLHATPTVSVVQAQQIAMSVYIANRECKAQPTLIISSVNLLEEH